MPLHPIRDDLTEGTGGIVLVLAGGVMFLMLLVCANVANLMLVRGQIRSGEDAVRSVLGCGNLRLSSQKFWESSIMGLGGGALGIALGWVAIRAVEVLGPRNIPLLSQVEMNAPAVFFGIAVTMAAVVVFGLIPALQVWRLDLARILRIDAGRGSVRGRRTLMKGLVISELALSTVLLSGALLMVRSMVALTNTDLGFDAEGVITFDVARLDDESPSFESWQATVRLLEQQVASIPGVTSIGRSSMPPLSGRVFSRNFGWTEEVLERQTERADLTSVGGEYFQTMGTRLLAGRFFDERDRVEGSSSIIVDEAIAQRAWPGEDPIGKRVYYLGEGIVVGVVESMLMRDFGDEVISVGAIHRPELEVGQVGTFVLRTTVDPASTIRAIRETVRATDPGLTPYRIQDLSTRIRVARAPTRFVLFAMGSFAVIALIVAIGGLFGVISYGVRTRTAEFGVRLALGAEKKAIVAMVLRQGAALALVGVVAGIGGTLLVSRVLASVLYEVSPTDPVLLGVTALILGITSVLACYAPARWASGLDPVRALAS